MYLRSLFPSIPDAPPTNYHHVVFPNGLSKNQEDYPIHVDVITGKQRSADEFTRDVYDAITALGMEKVYGGLKLDSQHHRVGILSDNCMEYITILHALIGLAVPFVPLSPFATQWELSYCLKKADLTHVLVHKAYFSILYKVAAENGISDENIVLFDGNSLSLPDGPESVAMNRFQSFRTLIRLVRINYKEIPRVSIRQVRSDTIAYLIFSSGTTGSPKAVMISHESLRRGIEQLIIYDPTLAKQELRSSSAITKSLSFLPFYHTYGLHVACLRSIPRFRISYIIMPRWNLDLALEQIPKYRINLLPIVPSIAHTLLNSPKYKKIDISSVKTIGFGAAHMSKSMEDSLQSAFPDAGLSEGYALSESTTAAIIRSTSKSSSGKPGEDTPTGILGAGFEALILRPDGTHCVPNEPGELYLKGNIALGYWGDPKATAETFLPTGWLRTGDIFSADSENNLYFKERAKDTLKISGLQVSPTEIEDAIYAEPSGLVQDVGVAGVLIPGSRFEDEKSPRAWIVLNEKGRRLGEAHVQKVIEEWTKAKLSRYKWLRGGMQFVGEISRNPSGKILRRVLYNEYANQHSHSRSKL